MMTPRKFVRGWLAVAAALCLAAGLLTVIPVDAQAGISSMWKSPTRTVYVENHAPGKWHVKRVAEKMDNGSRLNFRVVKRCPKGKTCVRVYARNIKQPGVIGMARLSGATRIVDLDPQLGDRLGRRAREFAVCHELGHMVGLTHRKSKGSCMFPDNRGARKLDRKDKQYLRKIYG